MRILLIDNYDSFTYNLVHYLKGFDCEVDVVRNDQINFQTIDSYEKIVLSPGPGLPKDSKDMLKVIDQCYDKKPILGVCLGFQALLEFFGGEIYNQKEVKHGVAINCTIDPNSRLFNGLSTSLEVGLYHSWAAKEQNWPKELIITAKSKEEVIMAFEHEKLPIAGVQFHPESILTENGKEIVENFLNNFN